MGFPRLLMGLQAAFLLAAALPGPGQIPRETGRELQDSSRQLQEAWYDRQAERADLVPGAFEVLRFPTGYSFQPRLKRDPNDRRRLLNPDFHCTRCAREGRILPGRGRLPDRLMDRTAGPLWEWIQKKTDSEAIYIEDDFFRLVSHLGEVNLRLFPNPFLKEELAELGDLFLEVTPRTSVLSPHQRAHLYLIRMHRLRRDFEWLCGMKGEDVRTRYAHLGPIMGMKGHHEVYLFRRDRDYHAFGLHTIGRPSTFGQVWHLFEDGAMVLQTFEGNLTDPELRNRVFHLLAHNLLDGFLRYSFKLPAWFQQGLGAWVERREGIRSNTYCYSEGVIPEVLADFRWLPRIRKRVATGDHPPFVEVMDFNEYGQMPVADSLLGYSWFCYLLRLGPEKMPRFIQILKSKTETDSLREIQNRAFREAYGITPLAFEEGWKAWVLAVYPSV
jgi:hypothetical protein